MLPYYLRFYRKSGHRARVAQFSFSDVLSRLVAKTLSRRAPARLHGHLTLSSASINRMPQGALPGRGGFGHGCFARPDGPGGVTKLGVVLEIERLAR